MSRSTNEKDSSSCEHEANIGSVEDVYLHPLVTDYDVGMVVEGPPPLQACNSCHHFETILVTPTTCNEKIKDKYYGTCRNSLQIIDKSLVSEDLDATCWNFCLREDLLKLKILRLRSQNANNITSKLHPE
jgi:hypothetical protein